VSGARVEIDESKWPIVYATWPAQQLDDEAFEAMVLAMSGFNQRGQPYVVIHDARRAARPTPKQRAFAAERQRLDAEVARKWLRGAALVVSNPLIAGVVTAINWIVPSPYPQKTFSAMADAEAWVRQRLAATD
jgi:hypothetical protein